MRLTLDLENALKGTKHETPIDADAADCILLRLQGPHSPNTTHSINELYAAKGLKATTSGRIPRASRSSNNLDFGFAGVVA